MRFGDYWPLPSFRCDVVDVGGRGSWWWWSLKKQLINKFKLNVK